MVEADFSKLEERVLASGLTINKKANFAELYGMGEVGLGKLVGRYPTGRTPHPPNIQLKLPKRN